jgi:hypothetical protein
VCSQLGLKKSASVTTSSGSCESEISDLDVEGFIEHKVFWLQITMCDTFAVSVFERVDQLLEVEPGSRLFKSTAQGHEIKQLTALSQLKNDVFYSLWLLLGVDLSALLNLVNFDDVWVVQQEECLDLSLDQLIEARVSFEDFDRVSAVGVVLGQLDLARDSSSQFSSECVFT